MLRRLPAALNAVVQGLLLMSVMPPSAIAQQRLQPWTVSRQPLLTLGTASGSPQEEFYRVRAAARGSNGAIYVANSGTQEIRIFDSRGRYVRSLGKAGTGPGEFRATDHVSLFGDTILVADVGLNRVTVFVEDSAVRVIDLTKRVNRSVNIVGRVGSTLIAHTNAIISGRGLGLANDSMDVYRFDIATEDVGRRVGRVFCCQIFTIPATGATTGSTGYPAPISAQGFVAAGIDGWWYGSGNSPDIKFTTSSGRTTTTRLPLAEAAVSREDRADYEEGWLLSVPESDRPRLRTALSQMDFPKRRPFVTALVRSETGGVWAKTYTRRNERSLWFVVDRTGKLLGQVYLPVAADLLWTDNSTVLVKQRDQDGVESVSLYGIAGSSIPSR
jgi:hypothetical protein